MSSSIDVAAYSDALVVLGTAGVVIPLVKRLGISPVLGYLGAGALLGPLGLGSLMDKLPFLYWMTVVDPKGLEPIGDLGVVFLMFIIGLELSFARLMTMRKFVFGLGFSHIVLAAGAIAGVLLIAGSDGATAALVGASLALSSTAIVIETLSETGRLAGQSGRVSFAVLLAQDLAVIPILMLVGALEGEARGGLILSVGMALLQALAALAVTMVLGRLFLRPLFRLAASVHSRELMIAAILFVIVGTGVVFAMAGMSMALGAFVAGLLLAETEYRRSIESIMDPFKGLFLGIFFFTVGMSVDLREVAREPMLLAVCLAGIIAIKLLLMLPLGRLFGLSLGTSLEAGLGLAAGGEFAFVCIGAAKAAGVVDGQTASFVLTIASISMVLIPALAALGRRLEHQLNAAPIDPEILAAPEYGAGHVIVVGFGRVGRVVADMLEAHGKEVLAVDVDPVTVSRDRRAGRAVHYGDATSQSFLKTCGIADAAAVVITVNDPAAIDAVLAVARMLRPDIPIFSRARDAGHARHLYALGVSEAVPETVESSLQLSETSLVGLGIAMGPVIASIHDKRDEFRREMQQAAGRPTYRRPSA
ncbi:cation:proton antiporter domain-containing protein [Oryzibacter oryziterrae]|uniref:cation:proton antiporter domain-containing protein n=1 Tax=Oryzibacter oryziterrae TaxID=2766474 RepID=UPI001F01AD29|nr:cation:proton antiporter [Oryzibacter oryziterrae]